MYRTSLLLIPIILLMAFVAIAGGCTDNERAKMFGGTMSVTLPCDQKLVLVTWKEASLWYATRPMAPSDSAVTYTFQEQSSFGINEGTVRLQECRR